MTLEELTKDIYKQHKFLYSTQETIRVCHKLMSEDFKNAIHRISSDELMAHKRIEELEEKLSIKSANLLLANNKVTELEAEVEIMNITAIACTKSVETSHKIMNERIKELEGRITHYEQYIGSINLHITNASNEFNKLDKSIEDLDEVRKSHYELK